MAQTAKAQKPMTLWHLFVRFQNPMMMWLLRSPLHRFVSHYYLLITVTGRKTGKLYTTPVQYIQQGNTLYIITSEGYTWWKNLRNGATVEIRLHGQNCTGYAQTFTDPQTIITVIKKLYPGMETKSLSDKVAITVTL